MPENPSTAEHQSFATGFILAGGASRRMGTDKALLPWENGTLLDHMLRLLSTLTPTVRVVGRDDMPDSMPDSVAGHGPLGGILTALEVSESPWNIIVGVDLPRIEPQFLQLLAERAFRSASRLVATRVDGRYPLCLAVHRDLSPMLGQQLAAGRRAVYQFIEAAGPDLISELELTASGLSPEMFANINTMQDWQELRQQATK